MANLTISYRKVTDLAPRPNNPRTHSTKQLQQIASSIGRFGFTNPVLIDQDDHVIAGHGRIEAAKLIGMTEVPTVCLADMSEAEIRAYVIADNRLAENAGWDRELLGQEFQYLEDLELDFDLSVTGFELAEIDNLIGEVTITSESDDPADALAIPADGPVITRSGDIWKIGTHRLICGDATKAETYEALLGEGRAQMVFADPPYNVPVSGHVCGLGKVQHREFAMASGEMSSAEFTGFLSTVFGHLAHFSVDGAIHFQCMDWRHMGEILAAGERAYDELKNLCVWSKSNGGMGALYRSQHELVFVFKSGTAPHINNVELGKHGRYRTNVWSYAGVNTFGRNREDLELHPTVKPIALVMDAIRDCSRRKDAVLDAFAGSGTTLIAAERTGRRGYGIEIDPAYCDTIIRRMHDLFGMEAELDADGKTFAELKAERCLDVQGAEQ
ncbi:DNA methyltransferase [Erythrobacter sp. Alg231-14]|uniref:DNA methyltransferase n=1 Tax=Erythrobacter sp. Alg231-14 TaxID=1922225 RepID=UPI000D551C38